MITNFDLARDLLVLAGGKEVELRASGKSVCVDGRTYVENCGVEFRYIVPRVLDFEDLPSILRALDLLEPGVGFAERFRTEASDYVRHAGNLRARIGREEPSSRRIVSVLPPPACPTAIQLLRRPYLEVVAYMRSERLAPLLPLDLLGNLAAAGAAVSGLPDRFGGTRLSLLVGSLHLETGGR